MDTNQNQKSIYCEFEFDLHFSFNFCFRYKNESKKTLEAILIETNSMSFIFKHVMACFIVAVNIICVYYYQVSMRRFKRCFKLVKF